MMVGIALACSLRMSSAVILSLAALSLFVLLCGLLHKAPKWLFGAGVSLFMFAAGAYVEYKQHDAMLPQWESGTRMYEAQLLEVPVHKGTSTKVLAKVVDIDSARVDGFRKEGEVYLYFPRSVEGDALEVGDILRFKAEVRPPANAGNPAEFDIEDFYYIKGITGSAYVWGDAWEYLGSGEKTLAMRALSMRERVVERYRRLGFEGDGLSLLSALTVGEKRDFPQELKENYTAAGASHILALSGLHLGIIYMLLTLLFPYRGRNRLVVLLRETVVVIALWAFAYVAGLPASVVRAALLFSLMSLGRCLRQEPSSLSSLAFAAIAMLLFSPHLLFDVSFQLSFSAVFAILLLTPPLQEVLNVAEHGRLYRYVANLLILTLAAQVGTLPFVWYHFGILPLYSLLTNILVVPLAFVLMVLALLLLVTSFISPLRMLFTAALQYVTALMNGGAAFISSLPGASLALPPIGVPGAVCAALSLAALLYALMNRRWLQALFVTGCSLVLLVVGSFLGGKEMQPDGVIVYNNSKNPLLHVVAQGGDNWLLSTVPQLDAEYEYTSSPYIKREKMPEPRWVNGDYECEAFAFSNGVLEYDGLKIRLLADELWRDNIFAEPVDVLVICRGFLGPVEELLEVYPASCMLLDASLYKRSRDRILRECAVLGVEAVDISRNGALKIVPRGDNFEIIPLRGK
ncbi:MAG: ComEC/Rec2 family competence protein [Bacteroidaceae bacterium]|nr:ComEC/Rec2 family competence protein [Bacteroidaceae bacterium]